jgi:tripartite-type tricarboxylate transporter receptor subunit TctC
MQRMKREFVIWSVIATAILCAASARAQPVTAGYPTKPITVIVPFAAGGPVDLETRMYTTRLAELLRQQVIVDYRPGAGTSIAAGIVARGKPDGYTLLSVSSALAVFPAFYKDLTFDVLTDLAPLVLMSSKTSVLMVRAASPFQTFAQYLEFARANPGKLNYGTSDTGGISHLSGMWLHKLARSTVTFVPYKGNGPLMLDLMAGRVDIASASPIVALPLIQSGKLRPMAIKGGSRMKQLPDIPTVAEHGMPEYIDENWQGFIGPAGMPDTVVTKLVDAMIAVAKHPPIVSALESQSSKPMGSGPAAFKTFIATEVVRWKKLVEESGMQLSR